MKIKFLQAYNGDSIWISFLENDIPRNIIIDGGIGDTYENNLKRKGDLFKVIEHIKNNEQKIDLLVMTHFDDDHIGGLLRWLNKDKEAPMLIKKVWFNSGKKIAKELAIEENQDLNIERWIFFQFIDQERCVCRGQDVICAETNYLEKPRRVLPHFMKI